MCLPDGLTRSEPVGQSLWINRRSALNLQNFAPGDHMEVLGLLTSLQKAHATECFESSDLF